MNKTNILAEDLKKKGGVNEKGEVVIKGIKDEIVMGKPGNKLTDGQLMELKIVLNKVYKEIIEVLKDYCDLREDYYHLVAVWILGTYLHDSFNTYPYLFINAMRGSGKTRLLKLIAALSINGKLLVSPTEAVLFRIPKGTTLCIDEFEGVMRKGSEGVREMLNASYKKGMTVTRMKKVNTPEGSAQKIEEFEPYKPICLANIWGMEEVLGDRCITMILEKSGNSQIMRILEDFDENIKILDIKARLKEYRVCLCSYFGVQEYIKRWNIYIKQKYTTLIPQHTQTTHTPETTPKKMLELFNKIDEIGINGRNLELFFPLFLIADFLHESVLKELLKLGTTLIKERRKEELVESRDVALVEWISQQDLNRNFLCVKKITADFRDFLGGMEQGEEMWINPRWVGRSLKRLNMILDKRRTNKGNEVTLNVNKAKDKIKVLKG